MNCLSSASMNYLAVNPLTQLPGLSKEMGSMMARFGSQLLCSSVKVSCIFCNHVSVLIQICMIGNICPETVEEVYALLPSLKVRVML